MILHAKHGLGLVAQPLDGLVIQINPIHGHLGRQRRRIHRKTMVLGSDLHPTRLQIFHRLISAPMPKLQLEGLATQRLAKNLMTQANPEDGRSKLVHITDAGRAFRQSTIEALAPDLGRIATYMPPDQAAKMLPDLESLRQFLDAERPPA